MSVLTFITEAASVILLVDFVSGVVHWAEDTFFAETTPVIGSWIVKPNVLRHHDGSAFTQNNWIQSSWDLLMIGAAILGLAWSLDLLTWQVWLFVIVGVNANQIHKWNHIPARHVPIWVRILQRIHIFQCSTHHIAHHRGEKNSHYCVITPALNPLLERLRFWEFLDTLVPVSAASRRAEMVGTIRLLK
jgi:plasmanylethanolamine desaturase